jgi:hypothetical protein
MVRSDGTEEEFTGVCGRDSLVDVALLNALEWKRRQWNFCLADVRTKILTTSTIDSVKFNSRPAPAQRRLLPEGSGQAQVGGVRSARAA